MYIHICCVYIHTGLNYNIVVYMLHTLAANSIAGMWQITAAPYTQSVQKKQPIKETMARMSEVSPFPCIALYRVEDMMCTF